MNYGCSPPIGLGATVGYNAIPALLSSTTPLRPILGDVVYLHLFGQGLIFLSSPAAVIELMERRSAIYSDRAPLVMVTELLVPCINIVLLANPLTLTIHAFLY